MIAELLEKVGEQKKTVDEAYKRYVKVKEKYEHMRTELQIALDNAGLKSAKGDEYLASIVSKSDVVITNEQDVIEWLRNEPDIEVDEYIGLKLTSLKGLVNYRLKEQGEIVPGTDRVIKDSIVIKRNGG